MRNIVIGITKVAVLGLFLFCCIEQASAAGATVTTIGSRGTVTPTATMYGGFTLASPAGVYIAVRGPSLQTLGVTNNPLPIPSVRFFDALGRDLLVNASGGTNIATCPSSNQIAIYYAITRGQALDTNDACTSVGNQILPAGSYTFTITPGGNTANTSGEVLFEVTINHQ